MGAADSREQQQQATPSRPLINRHLLRVIDPRSPSVGIPRTPIEVVESPQSSRVTAQEGGTAEASAVGDPRSPTQGIVRTPLRPSLHASLNLLAKQLSEVFVSEDSGIEGSPEANKEAPDDQPASDALPPPAESPDDQPASDALPPPAEEEKEPASAEEPVTSPEPPPSTVEKTRGKSPRAAGTKNIRQRPRKVLVSPAHGRSPLKILQEDCSPSMAVQNRQVKILPFQSDQPSSLRTVKISHSSWEMSHNKENTQYTQSEG
ncbi:cell division cycle-associated protein 3 [Anomaloglossus baeobatrachus]|uniref:cell division cycle-associated protein 3 n=1 Tax=Anomaloglossus baeobatrachus TaxID=238106 RepID=UPI003F506A5B